MSLAYGVLFGEIPDRLKIVIQNWYKHVLMGNTRRVMMKSMSGKYVHGYES